MADITVDRISIQRSICSKIVTGCTVGASYSEVLSWARELLTRFLAGATCQLFLLLVLFGFASFARPSPSLLGAIWRGSQGNRVTVGHCKQRGPLRTS